jgi:two-component system, cell cycle response regulator
VTSLLPAPVAVRCAVLVAAAWLVVHELHVVLVPGLDVGILEHRGIHVAVLLVAASSCLLAALRRDTERLPWLLIGLGLAGWTAGEAVYVTVMWDDTSPPIPSPADYGYLLLPALLLPGLWLLLRRRAATVSRTLWADGVTVGLAVSAVSAALVFQTLYTHVSCDPVGVGVALAYPLTDMVMLAAIAGSLAGIGWRLDRRWGLLAGGIVAFWLADSLYAISAVAGTYDAGGWFDIGWWGGLLAIGVAAWQPDRRHVATDDGSIRFILVPLGFGLIGLGLLVYAAVASLNALAVSLAALSLVAVMVRLLLTFKAYVAMIGQSRGEALTDSLTGLGNRRALTDALARGVAAADDADPLVLVLFDLDGFKHYNDCFGHPAGDALLERLGGALSRYIDGRGEAYRMGGDEFCVLFRPGPQVAEPIVRGAAAALTERGEGFHIGCSYGSVVLPREAVDAAEALLAADQRMYAQKHSRRAPVESQSKNVLLQALAERHPDLEAHADGVAQLVEATATVLGLDTEEVKRFRLAAELHDIGKIGIPESILNKPGPLSDAEWEFIRRHTIIGERILLAAPALEGIAQLVRSSHERWDGGGYPDALAGQDIPLGSRVVAIADAFDAMTADRPYSEPRPVADALAELRRCAGTQFDPVAVEAFHEACAARRAAAAQRSS